MNITIAIDSFKGSLTTVQAAEAIKRGIKLAMADANVSICPMADGGEGTVDAIVSAAGGTIVTCKVCGPLGKSVDAAYGIVESRRTAIIEMAAASGITLIGERERNPMHTTTYGVGELIRDAISKGCRKFVVGIGGSATNDGGVGMLQALGFSFTDASGAEVPYGAQGVGMIASVSAEGAMPELSECEFCIACDVKNPLCGPDGCSAIYGPQKGADADMIKLMDSYLGSYASVTKSFNPHADSSYPGAGAAGGLGFAFMAYLGARLSSGIELVMSETGLEEYIKNSDVVITGEGRLDGQSCMGKTPVGVASLAKKYNKPVIAFSGSVTDDATECNNHGIDAFFPILRKICTLDEAMDSEAAAANLSACTRQVFNLIKVFDK